ncbi:HAD domain-containing protein [Nocardia sp. CDC160]|uniref:HAD domain-containing protein n=1 Tax=Nocardia sp. CDC160 TaxID=3112166 RepID=UPI002DBB6980|nr:HAD domain-containing protein [Nocardia sp. CDC160]MEC3919283.1 HAD domain-containing protein [Nocardia sp. CDC160]
MDRLHRPLLFLDVDGPLIPFGMTPGHESDSSPVPTRQDGANPLLARLDPELGPLLAALPCELVWATTWMDEANRSVAPALGLPMLAVVDWPERSDDHVDEWFGLHWKTRTLIEWAQGRSFIWIDDEIGDGDREWVSEHHGDRALLHRVDPRIGLRRNDFAALAEWIDASADR